MFEMNDAGLCLPIDYAKIPNAQYLLPQMKYPYGVGHIYSGKVILYNPKLITTPPTSFADALDPKHGNKLGIIDIQYQFTMMAAALGVGRLDDQLRAGQGAADGVPQGGREDPADQRGDGAGAAERGSRDLHHVEGARRAVAEGRREGRHRRAEGGHSALHLGLRHSEERAEQGRRALLAERDARSRRRRRPSPRTWATTARVTNAKIPPETEKRIGFNAEERKRLIDLDYGYLAKNDAALKEWWDKTFKG